jgi:NADH-quinone oxidoreductase subunit N
MSLDTSMFLAILPQILLLVLGTVVLVVGLILPKDRRAPLGWVTAVGMGLIILFSIPGIPGNESAQVWGGMLRHDWLGYSFAMLFIFGAGVTAMLAMDVPRLGSRLEFYLLLIASTLGMTFMAYAADLVMLYVAIETTAIPLYILAGFLVKDEKSPESGFKYFLFGAMTSAIMLYGFSLIYGFTGTTDIYQIGETVQVGSQPVGIMVATLMLVLIGFAFKISVVPLQFWAPDVYEGAPTPVAGFLSTASKAAGFAVLVRFLLAVDPNMVTYWGAILAAIAVATMTLGNLIALAQKNIKRLLAYSSIAHAGYVMIGVVAVSELGVTSVVFYLLAYLLTNLAAFGIVTVYGKAVGSDDLTAYYGLSRRSPWLALGMLVAFLSLAGMPPLVGFVAKVFVFAAAVNADLIWLAVVGILNSIIGLYYYMTVLKYVYLYRSEDDDKPVPVTRAFKLALVVLSVAIILAGVVIGPWFEWANQAATALLF